jgi:hypothetical protein
LDYAVLVRNKSTWLQLYTVPAAKVHEGLLFSLADNVTLPNGGAELVLLTQAGIVASSVRYNDVGQWPTVADGAGPSLELRCPSADTREPDNWIASPVAKNSDCYQETTGTPGLVNTVVVCPPRAFVKPAVHFTEIFYHPVGGQGFRDATEFFEIYNAGPIAVNIGNWRFVSEGGLLRFTVPETNRTLAAGQVAVFVGDLAGFNAKFASAVPASAMLVSAFEGELANGGDKLVMMDDNGFEVDAVVYNDKFPWPLAADSLGVDNTYIELVGDPLPQADWSGQTYASMRNGGGFSLHRRSLSVGSAGDHVVRWTTALASPGTLPASLGTGANDESAYIPVVNKRTAYATGGSIDALLLENQMVTIEIDFLPKPSELKRPLEYSAVRVAYVVDDPIFGEIVTGGTGVNASMPLTRVSCSAVPLKEARFQCALPGRPAQTIVRYFIEYVMSNAATVHVSPRASDPMRYHAYFHTPTPTTNQPPSYYFYIRPDRWQFLQTTAERLDATTAASIRFGAPRCPPSLFTKARWLTSLLAFKAVDTIARTASRSIAPHIRTRRHRQLSCDQLALEHAAMAHAVWRPSGCVAEDVSRLHNVSDGARLTSCTDWRVRRFLIGDSCARMSTTSTFDT